MPCPGWAPTTGCTRTRGAASQTSRPTIGSLTLALCLGPAVAHLDAHHLFSRARRATQQLRLAFDDRILIEYQTVLRRPKFRFSPKHVTSVLAICSVTDVQPTEPWTHTTLPDRSDTMFLEVARAADCPLVAGNLRHFPSPRCEPVMVMSPETYLRQHRL